MNSTLIQPFYNALNQVLLTMAQIESTPGLQAIKKTANADGVVSGIILLNSPKLKGSMAISFSQALILDIYQRMLGEQRHNIDADICDLVGEITNMVTGAAKPALVEQGIDLLLTRPTTLSGAMHEIKHAFSAPVLTQPLLATSGNVTLELCFQEIVLN